MVAAAQGLIQRWGFDNSRTAQFPSWHLIFAIMFTSDTHLTWLKQTVTIRPFLLELSFQGIDCFLCVSDLLLLSRQPLLYLADLTLYVVHLRFRSYTLIFQSVLGLHELIDQLEKQASVFFSLKFNHYPDDFFKTIFHSFEAGIANAISSYKWRKRIIFKKKYTSSKCNY